MKKNQRSISSLVDGNIHRPFFVFRPNTLAKAASFFVNNFKGKCLYAVKTNPETIILKSLYKQGIRNFDVASLDEITHVHKLFPDCTLHFMHPVKSRNAIREAYFNYGVRHFSLDSFDELKKILEETKNAKDLSLYVRLSMPNTYSELALAEKFGINLQEAPKLMREVRKNSKKLGICFHVGSQCMHPDAYRIAIRMAQEVIETSEVKIDYFNVGGGFPSIYPGMIPPKMQDYFDTIYDEFTKTEGWEDMELLAEPGRAIVAESVSLIVRVELRKNSHLYINEGTYGSLFDAGTPNFIYPVKLICNEKIYSTDLMSYSFYGPTCDSLDYMKGPFYLPDDTAEGDFIEIGQMGAYGKTMATNFNGFRAEEKMLHVYDEPLMTMYESAHSAEEFDEVIAA